MHIENVLNGTAFLVFPEPDTLSQGSKSRIGKEALPQGHNS